MPFNILNKVEEEEKEAAMVSNNEIELSKKANHKTVRTQILNRKVLMVIIPRLNVCNDNFYHLLVIC